MQIRKQLIFIPLTIIALTFNAHANDVIFKCIFKNNKEVRLYKKNGDVTYSFGKVGEKPDLEINQKKEQIERSLGNFSGRYATNSITIKNGSYGYKLTTSVDRIAEEQEPSTSLTVTKNDNDITTLQCMKGSEEGSLISIDD